MRKKHSGKVSADTVEITGFIRAQRLCVCNVTEVSGHRLTAKRGRSHIKSRFLYDNSISPIVILFMICPLNSHSMFNPTDFFKTVTLDEEAL